MTKRVSAAENASVVEMEHYAKKILAAYRRLTEAALAVLRRPGFGISARRRRLLMPYAPAGMLDLSTITCIPKVINSETNKNQSGRTSQPVPLSDRQRRRRMPADRRICLINHLQKGPPPNSMSPLRFRERDSVQPCIGIDRKSRTVCDFVGHASRAAAPNVGSGSSAATSRDGASALSPADSRSVG
jgi:hypothetical protein